MMLRPTDPFRDFDRLTQQLLGTSKSSCGDADGRVARGRTLRHRVRPARRQPGHHRSRCRAERPDGPGRARRARTATGRCSRANVRAVCSVASSCSATTWTSNASMPSTTPECCDSRFPSPRRRSRARSRWDWAPRQSPARPSRPERRRRARQEHSRSAPASPAASPAPRRSWCSTGKEREGVRAPSSGSSQPTRAHPCRTCTPRRARRRTRRGGVPHHGHLSRSRRDRLRPGRDRDRPHRASSPGHQRPSGDRTPAVVGTRRDRSGPGGRSRPCRRHGCQRKDPGRGRGAGGRGPSYLHHVSAVREAGRRTTPFGVDRARGRGSGADRGRPQQRRDRVASVHHDQHRQDLHPHRLPAHRRGQSVAGSDLGARERTGPARREQRIQ